MKKAKKNKTPKPHANYCLACKQKLAVIKVSADIKQALICAQPKCPRAGLISLVGYKLTKKVGGEVKNGKLPNKNIKK